VTPFGQHPYCVPAHPPTTFVVFVGFVGFFTTTVEVVVVCTGLPLTTTMCPAKVIIKRMRRMIRTILVVSIYIIPTK
jgi:hypothetical protein